MFVRVRIDLAGSDCWPQFPQIAVVLVEIFTHFSRDRVQQRFAEQIFEFVDGVLCNWCARTPRGTLWWVSSMVAFFFLSSLRHEQQ